MKYGRHKRILAFPLVFWAAVAGATSVPSLSFEDLTAQSDVIARGQITRSWADWDTQHKYIWTHYELAVADAIKGSPGSTVVLSEPGGVVGLNALTIAGAVGYSSGENVLVFLKRMPNGYLRTTGWSQGKFTIDSAGRAHPQAPPGGLAVVATKGQPSLTTIRSLEGMTATQLRGMIAARIKAQGKAQ